MDRQPPTKTPSYTPGPWAVSRHEGVIVGGEIRQFANGSAQSQVALACMSEEVDNAGTRDANARLIAAAPELHEAVAAVRATLQRAANVGRKPTVAELNAMLLGCERALRLIEQA